MWNTNYKYQICKLDDINYILYVLLKHIISKDLIINYNRVRIR